MVCDLINNLVITGNFVLECSQKGGKTLLKDTITLYS